MALTPNIMMAGEGLIANTALAQVSTSAETANYLAQTIVADYTVTVSAFIAAEGLGDITQTLVDNFIARLDNSAPYISNRVLPAAGIDSVNYTTVLNQHAINLFPDNQRFVQYALIAMGAKDTANKYVNAAVNSANLTAQTFTTQDALITGNIAAVSSDAQAWGQELLNSGTLYDFTKLDTLGTPQALIEALMRGTMLGVISDELTAVGLNIVTLAEAINDNPELALTPLVQKRCYDAFRLVTGEKLTDILEVMQFTTPGIAALSDLLDLRKVFPSTFATITAPKVGATPKLQNIFTPAGNIDSHFSSVVAPLSAVVPVTIAISNYVFTCSLSQITGIRNSTPTAIGTTAISIEDNTGLLNTSALTEALPASIAASIIAQHGGGSGPNTTFYLTDFLGAVIGQPQNNNFAVLDGYFSTIQTAGGFDDTALVLLVMRGVIDELYPHPIDPFPKLEIPVGLPAAGFYNNKEDALNALLLELDIAITNYIAAYPTESTAMMSTYSSSATGVTAAIKRLWEANVRFNTTYVTGFQTSEPPNDPNIDGLPASKSSTLAFAENLGQYGKMQDTGDIAEILEALATDTIGGNAIIAAMREGRNKDKLDNASIKSDNNISDKPQ